MKADENWDDSTPNILTSPQFLAMRKDVMRQVRKAKRKGITYGFLSKRLIQAHISLLDAVLADLSAEGKLRHDPTAPAPSRIYRV